jgi:hypothetical protein
MLKEIDANALLSNPFFAFNQKHCSKLKNTHTQKEKKPQK